MREEGGLERFSLFPHRPAHQFLQQRVADVAQFEQADVRDHAERLLHEGEAAGDEIPRGQAPAGAVDVVLHGGADGDAELLGDRQAEAQLTRNRALLKKAEADTARYATLVERDYVLKLPDSTFGGSEEYIFKHNKEREALAKEADLLRLNKEALDRLPSPVRRLLLKLEDFRLLPFLVLFQIGFLARITRSASSVAPRCWRMMARPTPAAPTGKS